MDFCVAPAVGCEGGQQPTLEKALEAALVAEGPDRVRLPAGVVQGPGKYSTPNPDNTVDIVGAGRDATVITSSTPGETLTILNAGVLSDFTVSEPNPPIKGVEGTVVRGTVERVAFVSVDSEASTTIQGTARHLKSVGPAYTGIVGTIEDSEILGGELATWTSETVVRRVRSIGPTPIFGQNSHLIVSSSLLVSTSPEGTIAEFLPSPVENSQATVVFSNVTMIGGGGPGCTGLVASGNNIYPPPKDFATMNMTLANSVVRNCAKTLVRASSGGDRTANLTVFNSDLDLSPSAVSESGTGTLSTGPGNGNVNTDPLFLGLPMHEQELAFSSPLIDHGLVHSVSPEESSTDLNGNPRIVDGDGNGTATRDMGAFEYQRRPPVASATAQPASATPGETIIFTGSATESDPGESVTGLTWRFDDGAIAAGAVVSHAFATAGAHTATLTATDSSGASGAAVASVAVVPIAVASVRAISMTPSIFRAATRGASIAARHTVPVGTTVRLEVNAPTPVTLTFQRRASGRRSSSGNCVPQTRRNRRARACVRYLAIRGKLTRPVGAPPSFRFTGRLGGKRLAPGRYRLLAAAGTTKPKAAMFQIVH
jgi:PKD repeat protein